MNRCSIEAINCFSSCACCRCFATLTCPVKPVVSNRVNTSSRAKSRLWTHATYADVTLVNAEEALVTERSLPRMQSYSVRSFSLPDSDKLVSSCRACCLLLSFDRVSKFHSAMSKTSLFSSCLRSLHLLLLSVEARCAPLHSSANCLGSSVQIHSF